MEVVPLVAEETFRALFERHYSAVLVYARRRIGDDLAADVASEVFLVAWRRLAEVPPDALPWLYGVARRVVANQRRGAERMARLVERVSANSRATELPGGTEEAVAESSAFGVAFGRLSEEEREVLSLVVWEGLSARQAALVMDCSVPAVTMRLHRARRRLRTYLQIQNEES